MLTVEAHAKVNLTLEVLGRREDGYHDIASVMQTIDLHDTLTLEAEDSISLECETPGLNSPDNLVLRAANLLRETSGLKGGVRIGLRKRVPVAAGLGGGSSDAAATLVGLNRLWKIGLSIEDLAAIAAQLGSDVPFFLFGGTAVVYGRGDRVRVLPKPDLPWMVLLAPSTMVPDKTGTLYGKLGKSNFTKGALTRKLEARIRGGGDVPAQFLFNAFDSIAFDAYPDLEGYWKSLFDLGAREIHMAGSGPSLFAPISRKELGTAVQLMLRHRHGWDAYLVQAHNPSSGSKR